MILHLGQGTINAKMLPSVKLRRKKRCYECFCQLWSWFEHCVVRVVMLRMAMMMNIMMTIMMMRRMKMKRRRMRRKTGKRGCPDSRGRNLGKKFHRALLRTLVTDFSFFLPMAIADYYNCCCYYYHHSCC